VSWLSFTPAEGTTPATVRTWIDASELDVGEHSAQIFIEEPDSEYRAVVELTLHVDARRMMVSHTGVAFSAYPTAASRLSTSVAVVDSAALGLEWSASSNQDWLLAEPSDTAPGELELSADPAGLEPGKVHFGEVVVASDEPGVEDTEHIQVGLFVASADPPEVWDFELEVFEGGDSLKYVIDPVRPYVYLTSMDDAIRRFPLHPDLDDGQPTVFGDLGEQLGDLTISDDGSKLFVADVGSEKLLVLPLPDPDEPLQIWDGGWSRPTFVRTFGQELVFGDDNVAREAATGNPVLEDAYDDPSGENPVLFAPTRHGHLIFASDQVAVGSSGARSFHEYAFGYSELEGRAWFTLLDVLGDGAIRELLTNDRGDWVAAGDALYERQGDVLVELRSLGAGGCLRDVTPAGAWTHCSPTDLVRLYDPGGVKLAQYTVRTGRPVVARVSGDGTQLALLLRDSPDYHLSVMRLDLPDAE